MTTRQALVRYGNTGDSVAGAVASDTAGNGSLMRLAPVAFRSTAHSVDETRDAARRRSATTHAAPQALAAYAVMLRAAIIGMPNADLLADTVAGEPTIDAITAAVGEARAILDQLLRLCRA